MATAIKLAINAYSMAVAPVSSCRNRAINLVTLFSTQAVAAKTLGPPAYFQVNASVDMASASTQMHSLPPCGRAASFEIPLGDHRVCARLGPSHAVLAISLQPVVASIGYLPLRRRQRLTREQKGYNVRLVFHQVGEFDDQGCCRGGRRTCIACPVRGHDRDLGSVPRLILGPRLGLQPRET